MYMPAHAKIFPICYKTMAEYIQPWHAAIALTLYRRPCRIREYLPFLLKIIKSFTFEILSVNHFKDESNNHFGSSHFSVRVINILMTTQWINKIIYRLKTLPFKHKFILFIPLNSQEASEERATGWSRRWWTTQTRRGPAGSCTAGQNWPVLWGRELINAMSPLIQPIYSFDQPDQILSSC